MSLSYFYITCESNDKCDISIYAPLWFISRLYDSSDAIFNMKTHTVLGLFLSSFIGVIGSLFFSILTGYFASLFYEVAKQRSHKHQIEICQQRLHDSFYPVRCPHTKMYVVPRYKSLSTLQAELRICESDIIEAVDSSFDMRLSNLSTTYSVNDNSPDKLVVECFPCEGTARSYGYYINRDSDVTIVSTSSLKEIGTGHFAYLIAKFGGFNIISKEYSNNLEEKDSFFNISDGRWESPNTSMSDFKEDIIKFCNKDKWIIYILGTVKGNPYCIHFLHNKICSPDKAEQISDLIIEMRKRLKNISLRIIARNRRCFSYPIIHVDDENSLFNVDRKSIAKRLYSNHPHNSLVIRIPFELIARDNRHIIIAKTLAEQISVSLCGSKINFYKIIDFYNRKQFLRYNKWKKTHG